MKALHIVVLLIFSATCHSTTWAPSSVTDPISGKQCHVYTVASYGSYIYQWESKYDGVYWPVTDANWRWDCRESGYISFGSDFSDLTEKEVERISAYLSNTTSRYGGQFERMEEIYKLRNKDAKFWAWFSRVKAYWHHSQADRARRESIPLLVSHNAVKYFEKESEIVIDGEYIEGNDLVSVTTTNRGIPLRYSDVNTVFERGFRTEEAKNQYPAGTGFGLFIARRIVDIHEGVISAVPQDGFYPVTKDG